MLQVILAEWSFVEYCLKEGGSVEGHGTVRKEKSRELGWLRQAGEPRDGRCGLQIGYVYCAGDGENN